MKNSERIECAHGSSIKDRSWPSRYKIALVDLYDEGHHRSFLNLYARVLAESGLEVVTICPFQLEDIPPDLQSLVTQIRMDHDLQKEIRQSILGLITLLRSIVRIIRPNHNNIDLVFFMNKFPRMDKLPGRVIDIFFPFSWAVLDMHPILEERNCGYLQRLKAKVFGKKSISENYLSSRYLKFVAFLSETAPETYKAYYPHINFSWLPDATHERAPSKRGRIAAEIKQASNGRKIVTIAGSLEQRKGLYQMMYMAINADPSKYLFAFCGKPYWESFDDSGRLFREFRANAPSNCYFYLNFISDIGDNNEFDSILYSSDVIFAAMQGYEHSSNVVTKAARMRKPVIVSGRGICGLRVMKYRLGVVIPEGDVFCGLQALEKLTSVSHNGAWDEYTRDFSVLRLRQALLDLCEPLTGATAKTPRT
jgi:hypothetical protein